VLVGPVAGAAFLVYMRDAVPSLGFDPTLTPAIYGALLIVVLRLLPGGAAGALGDLAALALRRGAREARSGGSEPGGTPPRQAVPVASGGTKSV
jgi:hypothetical protein